MAWNQDNFNVLNEKQFEYCKFKNRPPLSVQYIKEEEKTLDAIFTEFDEQLIEEEEDEEEPYHVALKKYKVLFTYQVDDSEDEDKVDIKESKFNIYSFICY